MGGNTITVCTSFLIVIFVMSIFAFSANQNNGFLAYAATGDITDPVLASLEFEPVDDDDDDIDYFMTLVSRDIFAIVYDGDSEHSGPHCEGCLKTVRIGSDGTITVIDTFDFDDEVDDPHIIRVSDGVVAIVYEDDDSDDGILKTVGINSDGTISGVIATLVFEDDDSQEPYITQVSGDIFAIVYNGPGDDGFLKTVDINSDGVAAHA